MTALGNALRNPTAVDSKIIIYVEGMDDVAILEHRWFVEDSNVEFQAAGGNDNRGGCTMVISAVNSNGTTVLSGVQQPLAGFDPNAPPDTTPKFGL
ncbi:MAG TPA: hypothetical protein PK156_50770, partial [Polyangium sp.]|nr:hypothetical protein [Polyangium sp.]